MRKYFGWIKDKKDNRDYKFRLLKEMPLPAEVDLRRFCSPVHDQLELGSCTAFAIADGMREFLLYKHSIQHADLSPLFLYYYERALINTIHEDSGAALRDGFKVLANIGVATEEAYPYITSKFTHEPPAELRENAAQYKITRYERLDNLYALKYKLSQGYGAALGFIVRDGFETDKLVNTGVMDMPCFTKKELGGHAVFCCGYKDDPTWAGGGYLILKNSWGINWGDKGYFYMPYAYYPKNVIDVWTAYIT